MGVTQLWKSLDKGGCVEQLTGAVQEEHAAIVKAVEHQVIAVDLSVWLMQAQMQPALAENFLSPQACAVKVVFDRTCHWLRHGCLPVFVYEGQPPPDKLDRLRQRCIATGGHAGHANTNRIPFLALRQPVLELLTAMGVPSYQAAGEGEATCAALNALGWVHGCQTLDVDSLLFGAQIVYRNLALHTDDPKKTLMTRCTAEGVQRMLGISAGGQRALVAVAQLAGGDYDVAGAERVGEVLAVSAVRTLLKGAQNDQRIIDDLADALARGPDPTLDALTKCSGCKQCGHNSNNKTGCKQHGRGGCQECGTMQGCNARDFEECECPFHQTKEERVLNRVIRRACQTPGFTASTRSAVNTYAQETQRAVLAVQRDYGIAAPDSVNPFSWSKRPDARAVSALLCRYIPELDYNQVRLKLLAVLLEWDVRQGPHAPAGSVELRPTQIRKVSEIGRSNSGANAAPAAAAEAAGPEPWRYVLVVERVVSVAQPRSAAEQALLQEDLAIDEAWISNSARSRPQKDKGPQSADGGEMENGQWLSGTQGASQGAAVTPRKAGKAGTLNFSEKRSVRCSLVAQMWPELVQEFEERRSGARKSGGAGSKGGKKKSGGAAQPADERQHTITNYFTQAKANAAASAKASAGNQDAQDAGHAGPSSSRGDLSTHLAALERAAAAKAAAPAASAGPSSNTDDLSARLAAMERAAAAAAAAAAAGPSTSGRHARTEEQQLDEWLAKSLAAQADRSSSPDRAVAGQQRPQAADAAGRGLLDLTASPGAKAGASGRAAGGGPRSSTAAAAHGQSGRGRGRGSRGGSSGGMAAGSLDRFLQPKAASAQARASEQQQQPAAAATVFVGRLHGNTAASGAPGSGDEAAGVSQGGAPVSPTATPLWERLRRMRDSAGDASPHSKLTDAGASKQPMINSNGPSSLDELASPAKKARTPNKQQQQPGQIPSATELQPLRQQQQEHEPQQQRSLPSWMDGQYAAMLRTAGISPSTQALAPEEQQPVAPGPFAQRRALFAGPAAGAPAPAATTAPFRRQRVGAGAVVDLSVSPAGQTPAQAGRQPAGTSSGEVVDLT